MYLVMVKETELLTNIGRISIVTDYYAGMAPIFKRKKDAVAYAKRNGNTQVLKIAMGSQPKEQTNENR